jgi:hypothetical protein
MKVDGIEVQYIVLGRHLNETMTRYIDVRFSVVLARNNVALDANIGVRNISQLYLP